MARIPLLLVLALLAGELAGCASDPLPLYRPFSRRAGYSDVEIAPGRFRVTYQGTPGMSDGTAAELAKLRAADLARARSMPYLRILELTLTSRTYSQYEPAWYSADPHYRDGHPYYHQRLIREGHFDVYSVPVAVLDVELLKQEVQGAFEAEQLWRSGGASGLIPTTRPAL